MIMAGDPGPAAPLGADRRKQRGRVDLEMTPGIGSGIASGRGRVYPVGGAEQQPAHLAIRFGCSVGQHRPQRRS